MMDNGRITKGTVRVYMCDLMALGMRVDLRMAGLMAMGSTLQLVVMCMKVNGTRTKHMGKAHIHTLMGPHMRVSGAWMRKQVKAPSACLEVYDMLVDLCTAKNMEPVC